MTTMTAPAAPALQLELAAADYCDKDADVPVLAMVRLARASLILDLCKHHYEINKAALAGGGWHITDDRRASLS